METQVKGLMLTPQPDMEISTSQSAFALSSSGIIDPDFGAPPLLPERHCTLLLRAPSSKQHTHHPRTPRQAPATETPAAEGLTIYARCGGICNIHVTANLPRNLQ